MFLGDAISVHVDRYVNLTFPFVSNTLHAPRLNRIFIRDCDLTAICNVEDRAIVKKDEAFRQCAIDPSDPYGLSVSATLSSILMQRWEFPP